MTRTSVAFMTKVQDVNLEFNSISSSFDGFHSYLHIGLSFIFRHPHERTKLSIRSIEVKLSLQNPNTLISEVVAPRSFWVERTEQNNSHTFSFRIGQEILAYIENYRKGDLCLALEIAIDASLFTCSGNFNNPEGNFFEKCNLTFSIPRSIWVEKLLPSLGYQSFKLIEIPVAHRTLKEAYKNIIEEFNKAENYFRNEDYNKCVAHCRSTLDALSRNLKKIKSQVPSESNFEWLQKVDTATLVYIDEMNKSITRIGSKAHHQGQKRDFSRQEAESIYLVTLGLLHFVAHI